MQNHNPEARSVIDEIGPKPEVQAAAHMASGSAWHSALAQPMQRSRTEERPSVLVSCRSFGTAPKLRDPQRKDGDLQHYSNFGAESCFTFMHARTLRGHRPSCSEDRRRESGPGTKWGAAPVVSLRTSFRRGRSSGTIFFGHIWVRPIYGRTARVRSERFWTISFGHIWVRPTYGRISSSPPPPHPPPPLPTVGRRARRAREERTNTD